jgi:hypothetical protein
MSALPSAQEIIFTAFQLWYNDSSVVIFKKVKRKTQEEWPERIKLRI